MMRKKLAGFVLITSAVGGVLAGVMAHSFTSDEPQALRTPSGRPVLGPPPLVEVQRPVLVMNDDGTATLSATLRSSTKTPLTINSVTGGEPGDLDAPPLLVHGTRMRTPITAGVPMRIGGVGDPYRIRLADPVRVGSTFPMTIRFMGGRQMIEPGPKVKVYATVAARSVAYADVANNGPNRDISVHEPKIVVVPGQKNAYIGGWFESTINDTTEARPVAVMRSGAKIDLLHQTATGGPSGFFAQAGRRSPLGYDNYLDAPGDRDYVRASDVTIGETVPFVFRFPSGDVTAKFKVVQGKPDGTI